jgi:hypothetical protein
MLCARLSFRGVRKMIAENIAEKGHRRRSGAGSRAAYNELICASAAPQLTEDEVRNTRCRRPVGALALHVPTTATGRSVSSWRCRRQEGQMPGLIGEVLLPAFEKHYGFKRGSPEIEFFTEHTPMSK